MSVRTFGPEELANLAAFIANGAYSAKEAARDFSETCELLARVSEANAACFNDKYATHEALMRDGKAEGYTAHEIAEREPKTIDVKTALATSTSLHYNCDDEGGDFTLQIDGAASALRRILEGTIRAARLGVGR